MPMVSKVTATDRGSVSGMAGAGRDRGLSGGRGSRRWVSVLLRAVAAGAVALGAVLSVAPSAAAEEGLDVESQNRYVVEDAGVRATTTLTIRNTSPDQYLTDSVLSFYWDEFGIPVPAGTQNVQATSEGAPLQVRIEPTEDPSTAIAVASFRPLNYGQSRTIEWRYTIPGAPFRAADWTRVGPGFATFAAQGVGDPGSVGVVVVVPASMTFHSTGSFAERREGDAVTYTATENTDEYGIWAAVSARDPERADERAVEFGDSTLQLVSLPGDMAWTDFAAERVTAGLPVLEDIIGEPWPGGMDKIREDVSPHVLGHVWFDHTADEIVVAEDLDEATLFHELTHAWLNPDRLQERWLYEGLTEVVAYRAVEALGGTSDPWPAPDRAAPSALALNAWTGAHRQAGHRRRRLRLRGSVQRRRPAGRRSRRRHVHRSGRGDLRGRERVRAGRLRGGEHGTHRLAAIPRPRGNPDGQRRRRAGLPHLGGRRRPGRAPRRACHGPSGLHRC